MKKHSWGIALILITLLVSSAVSPTALAQSSNDYPDQTQIWTTGPGDIENRDLHGISKKEYIALWNLDKDVQNSSPLYDIDEKENWEDVFESGDKAQELSQGQTSLYDNTQMSWKAFANLAHRTDFSRYYTSSVIPKWNNNAIKEYESEITGERTKSRLPVGVSTDSNSYIKDAFIEKYSIDPSVYIDTSQGKKTIYTTPSGSINTLVDYRTTHPSEQGKVDWNHKNSRIVYQQLLKNGNIIDEKTQNEHTANLEYKNLAEGENNITLKTKIETKWKKTEYTWDPCPPPEDDDDNNNEESGGDSGDKSAEKGSNKGSEGKGSTVSIEENNKNNYEPLVDSDTRNEKSTLLNKTESEKRYTAQGTCGEWVVSSEKDITKSIVVSKKMNVHVMESPDFEATYAKKPNGKTLAHIKTDDIWTHTVFPESRVIASGWRIYSSRDLNYYKMFVVDGDSPQAIGMLNPSVESTAFPSEHQLVSPSSSFQNEPKIISKSGVSKKAPNRPNNVNLPYIQGDGSGEFKDIKEYTVDLKYIDTGKITLHGPLNNSTKTVDPEVKTLRESRISVKSTPDGDMTDLTFELKDSEGNPINTQNRGNEYILFNGDEYNTNNNGVVKLEAELEPNVHGKYAVRYITPNWWEVNHNTVYKGTETFFTPPGGKGLMGWVYTFLKLFVVFGSFYYVFQRTLKPHGYDLRKPIKKTYDLVMNFLRYELF